ncbi:MAG: adenosylmethionine--8-amino-7-oxononanoate transaminase [Bacteroidota bacterium]
MVSKTLSERDQEHLWHPLTQHLTAAPRLGIVRAKGALLYDEHGTEYIDGIASWYSAMYGHGNPHIIKAVSRQMQQLDFTMFSGFTHAPAVELSEVLMQVLPPNQAKIFFNDNGSTAIEAAIKMALQFHHNKGERRDTLIAFENGFHGDTFGAMSASGLSSYNGPFTDFLLKVRRIPPPQEDTMDEVERQLEEIIENNACAVFVFEPLIQGAAGMKFHSAKGLDLLIAKCNKNGVLTVADEIMTGFGKTGRIFASDYLERKPDMMCLGKALTAGMFPLSITSCSQTIFDAFLDKEPAKGFFHAHTFSAHPLGCAAALAGMELLRSKEIIQKQVFITATHQRFALEIKAHPKVREVRCKGVVLAIDLDIQTERYGALRDRLYEHFMGLGINLRPLGNTIYVLPPYIITETQLESIYTGIQSALKLI